MKLSKDVLKSIVRTQDPLLITPQVIATFYETGYFFIKHNQHCDINAFVDQKKFMDMLNNLKEAEITSIDGDKLLIKSSSDSNTNIEYILDRIEYMERENEISDIALGGTEIKGVPVDHLLSTISTEETYDNRQGIYLSSDIIASTNGVSITIVKNSFLTDVEIPIVVPRNLFRYFTDGTKLLIDVDGNKIHFVSGDMFGGGSILGGDFPDVASVNEKLYYHNYFEVDTDEFRNVIRSCIVALDKDFRIITIDIEDGVATLTANSNISAFSATIPIDNTSNVRFSFNPDILIKILQPYSDEKLKINFIDDKTPIKIEGDGVDKLLAVMKE